MERLFLSSSSSSRCRMVPALLLLLIGLWLPIRMADADGSTAHHDLNNIPKIITPAIDAASLANEEIITGRLGIEPPRFAVPFADQTYSAATDGAWEVETATGNHVWRLRIGALHVNLGFSSYFMPDGGTLVISSINDDANAPTIAATASATFTTAHNNAVHEELWTPIFYGTTVSLQVTLPPGVPTTDLGLELSSINAGFRGFGIESSDLTKSGACNVDFACAEGNDWRDEITTVGVYSQGGSRICTGALVNNALQDGKPYFLTAWHCMTPPGLSSCTCGGSPNGRLDQYQTGATFVAGWSDADFCLLLLDRRPDDAWNIQYAGWDRRGAASNNGVVAIHHPRAHEKRISFENDPVSFVAAYSSNTVSASGTHIRVLDWDLSTTEGGSSGSPLFDAVSRRVVGQLHGGCAACGNDLPDWYGRLSRSWEGNGSSANRRLRDWLDPANAGVVTVDTVRITSGSPPMPTTRAPTPPVSEPGPTPPPGPTLPQPEPMPPAPAPGPDGCFSERNHVMVHGVGPVLMQNLRVGDLVLVDADGTFEPVYSFCKRAPESFVDYIQVFVVTEDGVAQEEPLELTGNHLVFVQDEHSRQKDSVRAAKLRVGDRILYESGNYVSIVQLQSAAPAPYTASGTIVVNGILASIYATIDKDNSNDGSGGGGNGGILAHRDSHVLLDLAQTHHRVGCRYLADWCRRETYSDETGGLSPVAATSLRIYEYISSPRTLTVVKWILSFLIVLGLLLLRALELVVLTSSSTTTTSNMVIVVLLWMALLSYWKRQRRCTIRGGKSTTRP